MPFIPNSLKQQFLIETQWVHQIKQTNKKHFIGEIHTNNQIDVDLYLTKSNWRYKMLH